MSYKHICIYVYTYAYVSYTYRYNVWDSGLKLVHEHCVSLARFKIAAVCLHC